MEILIDLCYSFLVLLDLLRAFFFMPLCELPDYVFSTLGLSDSAAGTVIEGFFSGLLQVIPGLSNTTFAMLFLGSGLLFILLWRFVKFLIGLFS